jgi:two-component system sensor histidine kinase RegB
MGLGLFIAKTLLERSGAEISFDNAADPFLQPAELPRRCGAIVEVIWPADRLVVTDSGSLGENTPIEV